MTERRHANASANSTLFDFGIKRVAATTRSDDEDRPDEVTCEVECDEVSQLESNESCSSCSRVELVVKCVGVCCADSSQLKPNQPRDHVLGRTVKTVGLQKRFVNADWFNRYTWLTLCETHNVLFCHTCVQANRHELITF